MAYKVLSGQWSRNIRALVVEPIRKWPESGVVVQMPRSPVTLCRDPRRVAKDKN
jgi:hypothetical protein